MSPILAVAMFGVAILPATLSGQGLKFEVASIRPAEFPNDGFAAGYRAAAAGCNAGQYKVSGTLVSLSKVGLCDIIRLAYGLKSYQIAGVPAKLGFSGEAAREGAGRGMQQSIQEQIAGASKEPNLFYEIEARAPGAQTPNDEQLHEMLQALLAERFHLTTHREKREMSFFALVEAKGGNKLKPGSETCKVQVNRSLMQGCGRTAEQIGQTLGAFGGGLVIDMTGLTGKYDYEVPIDTSDSDFRATTAAAMQDRLGLRLESRKGPVEVLIVDRVEAPSAN